MPKEATTFRSHATTEKIVPPRLVQPTASEMLDWLEAFVNNHKALVLHTGEVKMPEGFPGLGLRPGAVRRTLRQAIADAMGRPRPA